MSRSSRSLVRLSVSLWAPLLASSAFAAPELFLNERIYGGVSVDATGVDTPRSNAACNALSIVVPGDCSPSTGPAEPNTFYAAKPLQASVPANATIRNAYLVVTANGEALFHDGHHLSEVAARIRLGPYLLDKLWTAP